MFKPNKKDNLTDVAEIAQGLQSNNQRRPAEGRVQTEDGVVVTLNNQKKRRTK